MASSSKVIFDEMAVENLNRVRELLTANLSCEELEKKHGVPKPIIQEHTSSNIYI